MAQVLGSSVSVDCPLCPHVMDVPLKETGRDGDRITVVIDMGPFRQHMTGHQSAEERL